MDVPIVKQTMRTIGCKAAKQIWCEADLWDSVSRGAGAATGAVQRAPEALYQWETVRKKQTSGYSTVEFQMAATERRLCKM